MLWYFLVFEVFVIDAILIKGWTKAAAPKYFPSPLFLFWDAVIIHNFLIDRRMIGRVLVLQSRRAFFRVFFQQLSSSYLSFSQNVHLIYGLSPFLRPLFVLDEASALTSASILMCDSSISLAVRSLIVKRSSSWALLRMKQRLANNHWLYVFSTPWRKSESWMSFGRAVALSWSFCNYELKLSSYPSI